MSKASHIVGGPPVLHGKRAVSRKTYPVYTVPSYSHFTDNNTFANLLSPQRPAVLYSNATDQAAVTTQEAGAQPNPIVAIYKAGGTINKLSANQGVDYTYASAHGWVMKDGSNVEISQDANNVLLEPNSGISDITDANSLPRMIVSNMPAHFNAVFVDNVMPDYRGLYTGTSFLSPNYPTVVSYANAYVTFISKVCAYLQQNGIYCIGNSRALVKGTYAGDGTFVNDDGGPTNTYSWWSMLVYPNGNTLGPGGSAWRPGSPICDGLMIENWILTAQADGTGHFHQRRIGTVNSYDLWTEWSGAQGNCQARIITDENGGTRPVAFHGHAEVNESPADATDKARSLYSYATFLINWDGETGNSVHVFEPLDGNSYDAGYATTVQLAYPVADKFEVSTTNSNAGSPGSNIWRRNFTDLSNVSRFVIVNPTYSDVTFASGDYVGLLASGTAVIQ